MGTIKKYRSWDKLIAVFLSLKNDYESTDIFLRNGIDDFCQILKNGNIIHSSINSSGKVWGAKSLIISFCDVFDPIIIETFPINSYAYQYLLKQNVSIPLIKHLQYKEQIKYVANSIDQVIFELESLIPISTYNTQYASAKPSDWAKIQKDTENLQLISRLLAAIHFQLGFKYELKWCAVCFRIANNANDYCQIHSSKNDTAYRKAVKVRKLIPPDLLLKLDRQNSKRKGLGEIFTIAAYPEEITAQIKPDTVVI